MLVISMRTRRFLGIKTKSIVISPGYALVLVLALAAFSLTASTVLTVLIVSDATIVSDALTVLGAEVTVQAVVAAAAVVDNHESIIQSRLDSKGNPLHAAGDFLLKVRHMRQIPVHRIIEKVMFNK